jgi:hypothetical protein
MANKKLPGKNWTKKYTRKKEMPIKDIVKEEIVNEEMVNKNLTKVPRVKEGDSDMPRVPRDEINDKIQEAIDVLEASKRNVSVDKLRRAEEEIDRALRILVNAQREIITRRNWFISE